MIFAFVSWKGCALGKSFWSCFSIFLAGKVSAFVPYNALGMWLLWNTPLFLSCFVWSSYLSNRSWRIFYWRCKTFFSILFFLLLKHFELLAHVSCTQVLFFCIVCSFLLAGSRWATFLDRLCADVDPSKSHEGQKSPGPETWDNCLLLAETFGCETCQATCSVCMSEWRIM